MNHILELTDDELRRLQSALHSYLDDFGHEEADVMLAEERHVERAERDRLRFRTVGDLHARARHRVGRGATVRSR